MLDQKADLYINLIPGLKFWDMCAVEALTQAMMGLCVSASHTPHIYDETLDDYTVNSGIVIAKNKKVFDTMNHRLYKSTGKDLAYFHE